MQDLRSLSQSVGTLLKQREQTVAVAESSAGGLISAALLSIPGASAYFLGGSVLYTRVAQRALLGVSDERMAGLRASTEDYALLNARTVRESLGATWGLSETGASGLRVRGLSSSGTNCGTYWLSGHHKSHRTHTRFHHLSTARPC